VKHAAKLASRAKTKKTWRIISTLKLHHANIDRGQKGKPLKIMNSIRGREFRESVLTEVLNGEQFLAVPAW
jgi:hypothetical protein